LIEIFQQKNNNFIAKVQIFLLIILFLALCNFIVGSFIAGGERKQSRGFVGYSCKFFYF